MLLALLILWSFVFDGTVLQAHQHPLARAAVHGAPAGPSVIADLDEDCPLCAAAASIEPLLPTGPADPIRPPGDVAAAVAVAGTYPAHTSRGHIWRSRAPPGTLAAP